MVIKRKTKTIDAVDRAILRQMYITKRHLSGNQIAKGVNLSGSAIAPRLNNLKSRGIIKQTKISGMRNFERTFPTRKSKVKIKSPRSILWGFNMKKPRRK